MGAAKLAGKNVTSFLEVRSRGTTEISKLWKRLHAHVKTLAKQPKKAPKTKFPEESDPAVKINEKPHVIKGANTTGMPEGMQEIMDEIKSELSASEKKHTHQ